MDPATLALLASELITVLTKLLEKGVVDPALEKGLEPLRQRLTRPYDKAKDEAALRKAVEAAALKAGGDTTVSTRLGKAINSIKDKPARAALVAAAAIEMVSDDPARLPPDLLKELDLPDDQRAAFSHFLFEFRRELVNVEGYGDGIRYANELHTLNRLDGLYELVAGLAETVVATEGGRALRVQIVPPDTRAQERAYLEYAQREFEDLSLIGRSEREAVAGSDDKPLRLEKVYIALNTTEMRLPLSASEKPGVDVMYRDEKGNRIIVEAMGGLQPHRQNPLSALRAVMESRRLVLLGDPGSGKSTFAQHLCLCLASARLHPEGEWPGRLTTHDLDHWSLPFYFPILVRLRAFAADTTALPEDPKEMGRAKHVLAFIKKELAENGWGNLTDHVQTMLEDGQAFVLLDGLDEVTHPNPAGDPSTGSGQDPAKADAARREKVAHAIADFSRARFPHARVLVTCRVKQYPLGADGQSAASWTLPGFPVFTLADFDGKQVHEFVTHWFDELHVRGRLKADPAEKRHSLLIALDTRPELAELAPKPILLTQMSLVHAHRELPGSRVGVYTECARLLLWDWAGLRAAQSGRRGESAEDFLKTLRIPNLRRDDVEKALDEAVFYAHTDGAPEVSGDRLRRHLGQAFEAYDLSRAEARRCAEEFIVGWLRGRNGLITPASGEDSFDVPHRSFREFMAGRYLEKNRLKNPETGEHQRWDHSGPRLVEANYDRWREVLRFAAGLSEPSDVADALNVLCPEEMDPRETGARLWLLLAGEIARDTGAAALRGSSNPVGRRVYKRLERHLLHLMRDTADGEYPNDQPRLSSPTILLPKVRLEAGLLLDALGWTPPDLDDFVYVRPSDFGLPTSDFYIGKYPVANLQYQRFLDSDDYNKDHIWESVVAFDADGKPQILGDEAWAWFRDASKEGKRVPRYWDDPRFGATHRLLPVVGVTWYEAAAYCAWLTRHPPEDFALPSGFVFRLPAETEQLAAAGGVWKEKETEEKTPRYPWQKTPAEVTREEVLTRANVAEADLNNTSPVCMYPAGMSLAGVMDMGGNVWEWQINLYEKGQTYRALRGGAWGSSVDSGRVAARNGGRPGVDWLNFGFRVVGAAPVSL